MKLKLVTAILAITLGLLELVIVFKEHEGMEH